MYRCWDAFRNDPRFTNDMPKIYWGGILISGDHDPGLLYISNCYDFLRNSGLMIGEPIAFPWNGINVHIHHKRTDEDIRDIFRTTRDLQRGSGDNEEMIL